MGRVAESLKEALREDVSICRQELGKRRWPDATPQQRSNYISRYLNGTINPPPEFYQDVIDIHGENILAFVAARRGVRMERRLHGADGIAQMRIEQLERELAEIKAAIGPKRVGPIRRE